MAESQKGASTTPAKPKEKRPQPDGDIGNEFLSSWKSSNDDAMDFNFEPMSKGNKKSTTKFNNLDMDFNLDADFCKPSSFKMDMPDLDFSITPRKSSKPKEGSEEKSSTGNRHEKEDHFSFSFDLPEMDGFDFDEVLKMGETKSTKKPDGKEVASEGCKSQGSKVHLAKGFDAFDDEITMKLPVSEGVVAQKVKTSPADVSDINPMKDNCPSKSTTFRTSVEASLQQPSQSAIKDSDQEKHLLEEKMFKEPYTKPVIEDLAFQSAVENDRVPISVPNQQIGVSSIGRNDDSDGVQNGHQNMDTEENLNHDNLQCEDLPLNITSEKGDDERNMSSRDASQENMGRTEQSNGDLDLIDGSTTSIPRKTMHSPNCIELQNPNPAILSRLDSEMALDTQMDSEQKTEEHLEPVDDTMTTRKDNEGAVRSKYFKKSEDSTPQKDQASSSGINVSSTNKNKFDASNLNSSDEMRVDLGANSAREGNKLVTKSQSCHEELKGSNSVILGSGQKLKSSSNAREVSDTNAAQSGQKVLANSRLHDNGTTMRKPNLLGSLQSAISSRIQVEASGNTPKSSDQTMMNNKLVVSRTESIHNSRIVSADGNKLSSLKDGLKKPDISILKTSRTTAANNDLPGATTLQRDTTAFRNSMKNMEVPRNTVSKISHPAEITVKQTPQTPSLKRKLLEVSKSQDFPPLKSLKRLSQSPTESRFVKENSEDASNKLACDRQRWEESKTKKNTSEHLKSALEVPREVNMSEPEILLSMEDKGTVQKAEAYANDLENMWNMLRKKHEEAKELLVRSVVNNNNLLMLYHPIYEEKIRAVQNLAARLMAN